MKWEEFITRLNEGEIIYFSYKENIYVIGSEKKGKRIQWYLSIHFFTQKRKKEYYF